MQREKRKVRIFLASNSSKDTGGNDFDLLITVGRRFDAQHHTISYKPVETTCLHNEGDMKKRRSTLSFWQGIV